MDKNIILNNFNESFPITYGRLSLIIRPTESMDKINLLLQLV